MALSDSVGAWSPGRLFSPDALCETIFPLPKSGLYFSFRPPLIRGAIAGPCIGRNAKKKLRLYIPVITPPVNISVA